MLNMDDTRGNKISKAEAARRAGRNKNTIDRWIREGKLTKYTDRLGHVYVNSDELDDVIIPVAQPVAACAE